MKVLRIVHSLNPQLGGVSEAVRLQQIALLERKIDIQLVSCDAPCSPWIVDDSSVIALGPFKGTYGYTPRLISWLHDNVHNYDAVIVDGIWQFHSLAVWYTLRHSQIPYYIYTHGMLDPWFKYHYPLKHFKKWLYWPWGEYRVLRDAKKVLFTCEEERELAKDSFWLYKVNPEIASLGIEPPPNDLFKLKSDFFQKYPQLQGKKILLFLSRIHEKKGLDLLIDSFSQVCGQDPNLALVIAGPGEDSMVSELKKRADNLGISNSVFWLGMLQGDLKWGAFSAAQIFCLPSHQENFGIVVAEALSTGTPVLISNKVNIWKEVFHDKAGFIDDDTVEGTIRSIKDWLSMTNSELNVMRDNALKCFSSRFQIHTAISELIKIITEK